MRVDLARTHTLLRCYHETSIIWLILTAKYIKGLMTGDALVNYGYYSFARKLAN